LQSVIDCSGCDKYMNKLDYIKLGRARNNFRTPHSLKSRRKISHEGSSLAPIL
jgi:hypothetical protein